MAWDRDLAIDIFSNISNFRAQGLPVDTRWNTHLAASEEGFWLDPKTKDFGPNGSGRNGVEVLLRQAEVFAELLRGQPFVEIRRSGIVELIDELRERRFQLGRALQLQEHVLHREVARNYATIIGGVRFGARVAAKRHQLPFINSLRDEHTRVPAGLDGLRVSSLQAECDGQDSGSNGGESRFS